MAMSDQGESGRIEQLIGALRDDNQALRDHAIASLSQLGEEAIEPLIGLMADEDVLIREAATIAIVRMGPSVVDRLIEALAAFEIQGPKNNIPAVLAVLRSEAFRSGEVHTGIIGQVLARKP